MKHTRCWQDTNKRWRITHEYWRLLCTCKCRAMNAASPHACQHWLESTLGMLSSPPRAKKCVFPRATTAMFCYVFSHTYLPHAKRNVTDRVGFEPPIPSTCKFWVHLLHPHVYGLQTVSIILRTTEVSKWTLCTHKSTERREVKQTPPDLHVWCRYGSLCRLMELSWMQTRNPARSG